MTDFQKPIGGIAVLPTGSFNFMRRKKDKDASKVSKYVYSKLNNWQT